MLDKDLGPDTIIYSSSHQLPLTSNHLIRSATCLYGNEPDKSSIMLYSVILWGYNTKDIYSAIFLFMCNNNKIPLTEDWNWNLWINRFSLLEILHTKSPLTAYLYSWVSWAYKGYLEIRIVPLSSLLHIQNSS